MTSCNTMAMVLILICIFALHSYITEKQLASFIYWSAQTIRIGSTFIHWFYIEQKIFVFWEICTIVAFFWLADKSSYFYVWNLIAVIGSWNFVVLNMIVLCLFIADFALREETWIIHAITTMLLIRRWYLINSSNSHNISTFCSRMAIFMDVLILCYETYPFTSYRELYTNLKTSYVEWRRKVYLKRVNGNVREIILQCFDDVNIGHLVNDILGDPFSVRDAVIINATRTVDYCGPIYCPKTIAFTKYCIKTQCSQKYTFHISLNIFQIFLEHDHMFLEP